MNQPNVGECGDGDADVDAACHQIYTHVIHCG